MKYFFFNLLWFLPVAVFAQSNEINAAKALTRRIIPQFARRIVFEKISDASGQDVFEIKSTDGKLIIKGNNANAMAVGLNYYLRHFCQIDISWFKNDSIHVPAVMPQVLQKIRKEARCSERFFLNYCTFGYTMPWWQWDEWEWFIDWMSLNGINMPLAITGQEAIWYKVWKKFGLTDQEIRSYFTGPAYLPWHRMSNIDHWDGPLPQSWLNNQFALQKKIVKRERELGMKPVLPAFSGHVPELLKTKYPHAKITSLGDWSGFTQPYHSYFLDPFDSLFKPIQKAFLEEQTKAFGTDHLYGTDPFNEVTPPSWDSSYLASVSKTIFGSISDIDPQADWLQMGWIFYFQRNNWTNERIKAYLDAVPIGKMTILDYFCDNTEVWKLVNSFYGQPYIWCYLGNFGGNTMMSGNLREVEKRMENTFLNGGENMKGLGSTTEGFGVNPMMYEYVFDKAWSKGPVDVDQWIKKFSERRFGQKNDTVAKAWDILLKTVYSDAADLGRATLTNARPSLKGHSSWTTDPVINYNNKDLLKAWQLLTEPKEDASKDYYYDVVDVGRQVLGNYFSVLRDQFTASYEKKDAAALKQNGDAMLDLLDDMDHLLSTNQDFLLGKWIESARKLGVNEKEKNYYEQDARKIITIWGEPGRDLTDYANRSLAGLTKTYYRQRWKMFIDDVKLSLKNNTLFNDTSFTKKLTAFEDQWTEGHEHYR
ncbi:MAG: alpha-N-acetylglucosaminidase, partial [Bacteroidota bacterium]|nr:alpha-N-acetylglucosaminidase [Bacteroidota bacterium]